jgi:signal peptidase I
MTDAADADEDGDDGEDPARQHEDKATVWRVAVFAGVIVILLLMRSFVVEPARVRSDSMTPTLPPGAVLLIDKISYRVGEPHRGDIVIAEDPRNGRSIVKRVVAVGGDSVGIEDGLLVLNGAIIAEDYIDNDNMDGFYFGPDLVPPDHVFLLGDNRDTSEDSRAFGPVDVDDIDGKILLKIWPFG